MTISSFLRGRMMKVITVVAVTTTLSVLDSEYNAVNNNTSTTINSITTTAIEVPMACCSTRPYSCEVTEDMGFLEEVAFALTDIADSRPTARWYAAHSGGEPLMTLLRDAKSRQAMGASFNDITALAIAEEEAHHAIITNAIITNNAFIKQSPACTADGGGADCKATAPRQPGCAVQSIDAGCRWQALTNGTMDDSIREAMAVLAAPVDKVSPADIEASADELRWVVQDIQRITDALEPVPWLVQAGHAAYAVACPVGDVLLSTGSALVVKAWDEVPVDAICAVWDAACAKARSVVDDLLSAGSALVIKALGKVRDVAIFAAIQLAEVVVGRGTDGLIRLLLWAHEVVQDLKSRMPEEPTAVDVASVSLDLIGEQLALAAKIGSDAITHTRDVVWAAYVLSRVMAGAVMAPPPVIEKPTVEVGGVGEVVVEAGRFFARRIGEASVPRRVWSGLKSAAKAGGRGPGRVAEGFRAMQQQAQEDAPPEGSTEHHLLYDAWV